MRQTGPALVAASARGSPHVCTWHELLSLRRRYKRPYSYQQGQHSQNVCNSDTFGIPASWQAKHTSPFLTSKGSHVICVRSFLQGTFSVGCHCIQVFLNRGSNPIVAAHHTLQEACHTTLRATMLHRRRTCTTSIKVREMGQ